MKTGSSITSAMRTSELIRSAAEQGHCQPISMDSPFATKHLKVFDSCRTSASSDTSFVVGNFLTQNSRMWDIQALALNRLYKTFNGRV